MDKDLILRIFGGTTGLARSIGISRQAVAQWPERLTDRMQERVIAAAWKSGKLNEIPPPSQDPLVD
jgi:hypothetical protein